MIPDDYDSTDTLDAMPDMVPADGPIIVKHPSEMTLSELDRRIDSLREWLAEHEDARDQACAAVLVTMYGDERCPECGDTGWLIYPNMGPDGDVMDESRYPCPTCREPGR